MRVREDYTVIHRDGSKVLFSVKGCHTLEAALEATQKLEALVNEVDGSLEFIADLGALTSFDREARDVWQTAFAELATHVSCITLVKGSALARMTASAVGLYGGIRIRACDSIDEALDSSPD